MSVNHNKSIPSQTMSAPRATGRRSNPCNQSNLMLASSVSAVMSSMLSPVVVSSGDMSTSCTASMTSHSSPASSLLKKLSPNKVLSGQQQQQHYQLSVKQEQQHQQESPFDNVLRTDDLIRARTMVSIGNFLHTYPPRLTLGEYIKGKVGNEGCTRTLLFLISSGIYPVTKDFMAHVITHFKTDNVLSVLSAMKAPGFTGSPGNVLHLAVKKGNLQVVQQLVQMGFDVNQRDDKRQTPIFYFIEGDEVITSKDPSASCFPSSSYASSLGFLGSSSSFDDIPSPDDSWIFNDEHDNYSFNVFLWNYLVIEQKAKLNIIDSYGETPLSFAVRLHRNEIIMKLLTNHSVEVGLSLDNLNPPFHVYCEESNLSKDIFKAFLARIILNRCVNQRNFQDRIALHCLLNNIFGQEDPFLLIPYVEKLVDAGSDLTAQDSLGITPHMLALHHNYPYELLRLLIPSTVGEAMYSLNLKNKIGYNSLAMALIKYPGEEEKNHTEGNNEDNDRDHRDTHASWNPGHPLMRMKTDSRSSGFNSSNGSVICQPRGYFVNQPVDQRKWEKNRFATFDVGEDSSSTPTPTPASEAASIIKSQSVVGDVGPNELSLHLLLEKLLSMGAKLEPYVTKNRMKRVADSGQQETLLSLLVQNKHLSHRTLRLLLKKGLINVITFDDIWSCLLHFRLDFLYELIRYAEEKGKPKRGVTVENPIHQMIRGMKGLSINILDHIYSFRHIYLEATSPSTSPSTSFPSEAPSSSSLLFPQNKNQGMTASNSSTSLSSMMNLTLNTNPVLNNEPGLPQVTRILAKENLNRVHPLIVCLTDSFDHSVNQVVHQIDHKLLSSPSGDHRQHQQQTFTLLHALIQAHSWVPLPQVVNYVLIDKSSSLDINVVLEGRGSPINYAIRLGEFMVADKLLEMKGLLPLDVSKIDLRIPVLPLKRGFSETMRKLMKRGVKIPKEFCQQVLHSRIDDPLLEVEFLVFMRDVKEQQKTERGSQGGRYSDRFLVRNTAQDQMRLIQHRQQMLFPRDGNMFPVSDRNFNRGKK